ncbi:MAG: NADH-cytochrome b5 reductase [Chaenotheca gracillima]|nr:MAG: NADH-cytochrome b5 reductase [Chaenotheca gracillima]
MSATSPVDQGEGEEEDFPLTEVDREVLSQTDEEFHYHNWDELRSIIEDNDLGVLKRKPSDLRRYMKWSAATKAQYGSMTAFVCQERLHWTPLPPDDQTRTGTAFEVRNMTPFADPRDYKILVNDWPYGLSPGITHLIVWSKTPIEVDATDGAITSGSRRLIEDFVGRTFTQKLTKGEDKVLWFKNWTALQSVRSLEHVHVLVRDVPLGMIEEWTS